MTGGYLILWRDNRLPLFAYNWDQLLEMLRNLRSNYGSLDPIIGVRRYP